MIVSMGTIIMILIMCLIVLVCAVIVYRKKAYSKYYTSIVCIIST